jgi:hypothetical protein
VYPVTGITTRLWGIGIHAVALGIVRIVAGSVQPPRAQAAQPLLRRLRRPAANETRAGWSTAPPGPRHAA